MHAAVLCVCVYNCSVLLIFFVLFVSLQDDFGDLAHYYLWKNSFHLQKEEEKPREKERGKTRAIDKFLEELKFEQELREKRNQERENWREGRHNDNSAVSSRFILFFEMQKQVNKNFMVW